MPALLYHLRNTLHLLLLVSSVVLTHLSRPAHFETSPAEELQTRIFIMASFTIVSLFVVRIEELFVQEGEEEEGEVGGTGAELRETRNDLVWLEGVVGSVGSGWWVAFVLHLLFKIDTTSVRPVFLIGSYTIGALSTLSFVVFLLDLFSDGEDEEEGRRVEKADEEKAAALVGNRKKVVFGADLVNRSEEGAPCFFEVVGWAFLVSWSVACAFVSIRWTVASGFGSPAHLFVLPSILEILLVFRPRNQHYSIHLFTTSIIYILHSYATAQYTLFYLKLTPLCDALRASRYTTPLPCHLSGSVYVLSYVALMCIVFRLLWLHSTRPRQAVIAS
ncbi:hypothetical protein BDY24DRAFT_283119 [Mrakia frigida]|uniref:uncharacterized protein n=1 Tax=Mrakia frigida TaxID=29902 RepID=UPI003FCC1F16